MSDTGPGKVVGKAVAAAAAELAESDGDQPELFDVPTSGRDEVVRARVGDAGARAAAIARGPGRPPGSVNKATAEMRQWLLGRSINPLEWFARWGMHTPDSLAAELGCTRLEAFDRLAGLHRELAPYLFGRPVPFFQFNLGAAAVADRPPWEYLEPSPAAEGETAESGHSAETDRPQSHSDQSHGGDK